MKRILPLIVALTLCFGLTTTIAAADTDFYIENGVLVYYAGFSDNVVIPDGVTTIGNGAFSNCPQLTSVVIPGSVTKLEIGAFHGCSLLTNVDIPASVVEIGARAFEDCISLKQISIPDSVLTMGGYAFSNCTDLEAVTLGKGLTTIPQATFDDCSKLSHVTIPDTVRRIEKWAFRRTGIVSLALPNNGIYVEDYAFYDCKALTQLTLPDSVRYEPNAFVGCDQVEFQLSSSPAEENRHLIAYRVSKATYYGRPTWEIFAIISDSSGNLETDTRQVPTADEKDMRRGWEQMTLYELLHVTDGDCPDVSLSKLALTQPTEILIPAGVKRIPSMCFLGFTQVKEIVLPDSVTTVGGSAFAGCDSLEQVTFGKNCFYVDDSVFSSVNLAVLEKMYGAPPLEKAINHPNPNYYKSLANTLAFAAEWSARGVENCVLPQSQRITDTSDQICAGISSDYEKARAIYQWVSTNIAYDFDHLEGRKAETAYLPEDVLDQRLAICDGYACLTQALLQAQEIPALHVSGIGGLGDTAAPHAWNMAYIDGRWINIDTTWGNAVVFNSTNSDLLASAYTPHWFDVSTAAFVSTHWGDSSDRGWNSWYNIGEENVSATPNRSTVLVNGQSVAFDAYTINQNNYFKLRDLAKVLSGTGKQFEVTWDGASNAINMVSRKPYTTVGGELTQGDGTDKTASLNTAIIYLDGTPVQLTAYTINQNNYFKLRDVGQTFDFDVTWDGTRNTIIIDTTKSYSPD